MKKTSILIIFITAFFLAPEIILAEETSGPYAGGFIGGSLISDSDVDDVFGYSFEASFDMGFMFGIVGGYDFGKVRVDGQFNYMTSDIDKFSGYGESIDVSGDVSAMVFLISGWLEYENDTAFTPYFGAGIGMAKLDVSKTTALGLILYGSDSDEVFAYHASLGTSIAFNDRVSGDIGYRYFATADPSFEFTDTEFSSHNLLLGLRFSF